MDHARRSDRSPRRGAGRRSTKSPPASSCRSPAYRSPSKTTWTFRAFRPRPACPAFAYWPQETAPVVQRLLDAGAILIGKTNLDQFATGLVGTRSPYGACASVYNRDYISGGSSSGSAVAVAAGLVAFALGTDTAGSGRVPAAFNHLVGLKPTKGRWSARGVVPACRSQDCVSVFTSTVADAACVDDIVAYFDAADPYARHAPERVRARAPSIFRVGVPSERRLEWFSDRQSEQLFRNAVTRIRAMGGKLVEIDIAPLREAAKLLYEGPWVAERTIAAEALLTSQPGAIHPVVRGILERGLRFSAVEAFKAEYRLRDFQRAAERLWETVDVLLLPTTPTAYRLREVLAEPLGAQFEPRHLHQFREPAGYERGRRPGGLPGQRHGLWRDSVGAGVVRSPAARPRQPLRGHRTHARNAASRSHGGRTRRQARRRRRPSCVHAVALAADFAGTPSLVKRCKTAPAYKLYAMANTTPAKPALVHVGEGGAAIEVEVYDLTVEAFGSFTAEVPPPLAIGTVTLDDGTDVKGFVAEPRALVGAEDITALGGWRAYIARQAAKA